VGKRKKAITSLITGLLLGVSLFVNACAPGGGSPQTGPIQRYQNGFLYCRPTAYDPDVAKLVPECKPDPAGSKVYQLTTTVWTRRTSSSSASSPDHPE